MSLVLLWRITQKFGGCFSPLREPGVGHTVSPAQDHACVPGQQEKSRVVKGMQRIICNNNNNTTIKQNKTTTQILSEISWFLPSFAVAFKSKPYKSPLMGPAFWEHVHILLKTKVLSFPGSTWPNITQDHFSSKDWTILLEKLDPRRCQESSEVHFPSSGEPLRPTYPRADAHVHEARRITLLLRFDLRFLIQAPPEFVQILLL